MEESDYAKTILVLNSENVILAAPKSPRYCLSVCNESLKFEKTEKKHQRR